MKICRITTNPKTNIFGHGSSPNSPLKNCASPKMAHVKTAIISSFNVQCGRPNVAGLVDNQATAIYPQGSELKKKCLTYNSYESMCALNFPMFIFSSFSPHNYSEANTRGIQCAVKVRLIELFHSRGQQLCKFVWTKDGFYLTKKDQLPKNWFEAPKWPPFHGLGTTICRDVMWKRSIGWRKSRIVTIENLFDSLLFDKLFAPSNYNSVNNVKCAIKRVL